MQLPPDIFRYEPLVALCGEKALARARQLLAAGKAELRKEPDGDVSVRVATTPPATVWISGREDGLTATCECESAPCLHLAAALLLLRAHPGEVSGAFGPQGDASEPWQVALHRALDDAGKEAPPSPGAERLVYLLELDDEGALVIETRRVATLATPPEDGALFSLVKSWGADPIEPRPEYLTDRDVAVCRRLRQYPVGSGRRGSRPGSGHRFCPPRSERFGLLLELVRTGRLYRAGSRGALRHGPSRMVIPAVEAAPDGGLLITLPGWGGTAGGGPRVVASEPPLYLDATVIGVLVTPFPGSLTARLAAGPVHVPVDARKEFAVHWLPRLTALGPVDLPPELAPKQVDGVAPVARLTLDDGGGVLELTLSFVYGEGEGESQPVGPGDGITPLAHVDGGMVAYGRDEKAEQVYVRRLRTPVTEGCAPPVVAGSGAWMLSGDDACDFLLFELPLLAREGWQLFGEENLVRHRLYRGSARMTGRVRSGIDWFDLKVLADFDGVTMPPAELLAAWEAGRRYVALPDGRIARIPDWVRERAEALEEAGLKRGESARLTAYQVPLLLELTRDADTDLDAGFERAAERLAGFSGIRPVDPPKGLGATLRPYQREGLAWLEFLREYGFHGILADDMGLGKTIQVLALLLLEKQRRHLNRPSLIVVPTSLIFNWVNEIRRFAPDLTVAAWHGPDRRRGRAKLEKADLILTNYALVRQDQEMFEKMEFHYLVLDEAQYVKNPESQVSRAVRQLAARHRLALTGTPLENHLGELWAQFSFLMPGLLGSFARFRRHFGGPIERGDTAAAERLLDRVRPFILRRAKDQVARELPARVESTLFCQLEGEQRKLYDQIRDLCRAKVEKRIRSHGLSGSRVTILDALLKLRQVCCHPELLPAALSGGVRTSAKMELFTEFITEAMEEGHRVLVFSQFVAMLKVIRRQLDAAQVPYVYLDGRTRDREARVRTFQESPEIPVFLISLKAGGTGLNLTGADYVVHFDPWWNPAVEAQATDRAHRIGQTRKVFSYKLIAQDTVEEKIVALQEKKRALSDVFIGGEKELVHDLSLDDLERIFGRFDT